MNDGTSTPQHRSALRPWIGVVAVVIYVAAAAGISTLLTGALDLKDPLAELVVAHTPVLALVVAGILFVRWSGWTTSVWRTTAVFDTRPRRWWMLAIPLLLLAGPIVSLASTPSDNDWNVGSIAVVGVVFLLVGLGEELYFRGIFRASLRAHIGETLTLLITSAAFGIAHSFASLFHGLPVGFVLFQVAVTALAGIVYYGAFLATGRLWVPILLHALGDFSLTISSGTLTETASATTSPGTANVAIQAALWALAVIVVISCIRQDRRARRDARVDLSGHRI